MGLEPIKFVPYTSVGVRKRSTRIRFLGMGNKPGKQGNRRMEYLFMGPPTTVFDIKVAARW